VTRSNRFRPLALAILFATGCPRTLEPPPPYDAGPQLDAPDPLDFSDSDSDGVCNRTESQLGTDPLLPDSDGDSLSDRAELDLGYDPTRQDSPQRSAIVLLDERASATAHVAVSYVTPSSTEGRDFTGTFLSLDIVDPDAIDAEAFYTDSFAIGADPMGNVFEVEGEAERFGGVFGLTELVFDVRLAFGPNPARGCVRAYPWRYNVKRDDGTIVAAPRYLLVIVPDGESVDTAAWCLPEGPCI
jgi:hypothetical protein